MAVSTRWGWSLSNPIHLNAGGEPEAPERIGAIAAFAILASLLLHAILVWLVVQNVVVAAPPRAPISVTIVRPPPVPKPAPKPVPKPVIPVKVPVKVPVPHPAVHREPPPPPVKLVNHFATADDDGLNLNLAPPASGTGHGSMSDFDDAVKQSILAHKTYPPGIKGMWNECMVSYRVTVDHSGQLLSYKLFGCGNPFLDSATRAAILEASPFPVPPDFGGGHYDVYGSLVFIHP